MKGGDLSNILGSQIGNDALGRPVYASEIYDPATTRPVLKGGTDTATGLVNNSGADAIIRDGFGFNSTTGLPIPGQANVIPSNRIDPVAKKMFSYFADRRLARAAILVTNSIDRKLPEPTPSTIGGQV
jgi:hypothetical protein